MQKIQKNPEKSRKSAQNPGKIEKIGQNRQNPEKMAKSGVFRNEKKSNLGKTKANINGKMAQNRGFLANIGIFEKMAKIGVFGAQNGQNSGFWGSGAQK